MTVRDLIIALLDADMDSLVVVEDGEPYGFEVNIEEDVFLKLIKE